MTTILLVLGFLLIVGGVGAVSLPAGAICGGCLCVALAVGLLRAGGSSEAGE